MGAATGFAALGCMAWAAAASKPARRVLEIMSGVCSCTPLWGVVLGYALSDEAEMVEDVGGRAKLFVMLLRSSRCQVMHGPKGRAGHSNSSSVGQT